VGQLSPCRCVLSRRRQHGDEPRTEATLKKYGGEIRYKQTVNKIEIKDGRAVAVETEKGLRIEADVIVSNANSPDTLLKFVGREHLPPIMCAALKKPNHPFQILCLYLGLDRDLRRRLDGS
jgi:phytoene dehydrogenase-like protein